jgi:hypothetical protein
MATWSIVNSFKEAVAEKVHNLGGDVLKVALTNTAPSLSNTVLTDITQIGATGGYVAATVTINSSAQSGGTYTLSHDAVTFTATGADFDAFRYVVLYNDTAATDELIGYVDYGVSYVLPDGLPFTLNAGNILTIA